MPQKKDKNFACRMTKKDWADIHLKAKQAKMTVTDYVTQTALGKEIIVVEGLTELVKELKAIGNNLNQLTILAHQGRGRVTNLSETCYELEKIYLKLNEIVGGDDHSNL